jgi:hypothetical protein
VQRRGEIERRALSTPSAEESRGSFSGEIERRALSTSRSIQRRAGALSLVRSSAALSLLLSRKQELSRLRAGGVKGRWIA